METYERDDEVLDDECYFDLEAFNYMLNRRTLFTDSFFEDATDSHTLIMDHAKLQNILAFMESIDPILLE